MDSLKLQEALLIDPISSEVLEEHEISPSVLSFLQIEKANQKENLRISKCKNGSIKIAIKEDFEIQDPAELTHQIAHLINNKCDNHEIFAISKEELTRLDQEFLSNSQYTIDEHKHYLPLYQASFMDPKIGRKYFEKLFKTAQREVERSLHRLSFSSKEKTILNMLRKIAVKMEVKLYVVGGGIRDKLLGKENQDLDFMVVTDNLDSFVNNVTQAYQLKEPVKLDRSQAYMLRIKDVDVDIIDARRVYVPLSRVKEVETLEEEDDWSLALDDIFRRDLTINAIIYDVVANKVLDPTRRGVMDLKQGIIQTIIDPYVKYRINAFDMLRALRFAAVYNFALGNDMLEAMKENTHRIIPRNLGGDISNRRILRELRKAAVTAETWFRMKKFLAEVGLIDNLIEDIEKVEAQRTSLSPGEEGD